MRYAIKTAPQMTTWDAMLEVWQAADGIELFESAWNFDHFEPILGKPRSGPCLEGWTSLAALAQATSRIRIGCMVTGMPYRHPSVLANMAATVDVVSGGRLELGLGAGWNQTEADALGIEMPPLRERFDRFDEGLEVIVRLLSDEVADYRAVARHAQCWNTPFTSPDALAHSLEILHGHCEDVGRDPGEITITAQVIHDPTAGPAATADAIGELGAAGCELVVVYLPETHHTADEVERLAGGLA